MNGHARSVQLGVRPWDKPAACVKGDVSVGTSPYAVSDPRLTGDRPRYNNVFRIVPFDTPSPAVAGPGGAAGGIAVADPRGATSETYSSRKYKVTPFSESSRAVIGASSTGEGAFAVADPRPSWGNQHQIAGIAHFALLAPPVQGIPTPDEMIAAYRQARGKLDDWEFAQVLGEWRLAVFASMGMSRLPPELEDVERTYWTATRKRLAALVPGIGA